VPKPKYGQPNGVRLNPRQDERCRSAIQTTALLQRLNAFSLELEDPRTGKLAVMSGDQIRAALGLLRKTMPDLAVTQHVGPDGGPVMVITGVERVFDGTSLPAGRITNGANGHDEDRQED
jgi:hypothetical protein